MRATKKVFKAGHGQPKNSVTSGRYVQAFLRATRSQLALLRSDAASRSGRTGRDVDRLDAIVELMAVALRRGGLLLLEADPRTSEPARFIEKAKLPDAKFASGVARSKAWWRSRARPADAPRPAAGITPRRQILHPKKLGVPPLEIGNA